ncbi:MAG: ABC-F family ATP-binding cassette domain-containing protein [Chitinophagales bacterium]|nr:ABC-F family ATP-binding cassette domain-containing protein [Chitinophagales bacterium]
MKAYLCVQMNFLSVNQLSKFYGDRLLFEDLTFFIEKGQKVALIARNGSGKSTLLKIIQGLEPPESGEVKWFKDLQVGFLVQEPQLDDQMSVYEAIMNADHPLLRTSLAYEQALEGNGDLSEAIENMDRLQAWDYEVKVKQILSRFKIHHLEQKVGSLSGGQKKRLALSILLLTEPEFLILDEPTNHLDMDMIEWLESYLSAGQMTLLMVTHDRYFLENICNEIFELEDGKLYRHKGNYSKFLENKIAREDNIKSSAAKAKNTMRKELEWLRRQPKARTTKSKARIDAFDDIKEKASQKVRDSQVQLEINMNRLGGKILELHNISKSYGNQLLIDKFSYKFSKGDRIGIVGNNGVGKSTFLNIIMGSDTYDSGNLIHGETVVWGYYHQQGLQLKSDKRVIDVIKDIAEVISVGKSSLSAAQLLERFLFDFGQQYQFVSTLSGGEKRRLYLLTVLMLNPNFLILDEPTNDLDILTLQILEEFLMEFQGCLLLVSHDRYFLDKLTDHLFVFEGDGKIKDFNGNFKEYRQYIKEKEKSVEIQKMDSKPETNKVKIETKRRLTYKEKQELDSLEAEIEQLDLEQQELTKKISQSEISHDLLTELALKIEQVLSKKDEKELRWLELSEYAV